MVSMVFFNENPDLQRQLLEAVQTGLTRVELRFEHFHFRNACFYKSKVEEMVNLVSSSECLRL
jgi:hypothetical protein